MTWLIYLLILPLIVIVDLALMAAEDSAGRSGTDEAADGPLPANQLHLNRKGGSRPD